VIPVPVLPQSARARGRFFPGTSLDACRQPLGTGVLPRPQRVAQHPNDQPEQRGSIRHQRQRDEQANDQCQAVPGGYADKTRSDQIDALVSVALLEVWEFIGAVEVFAYPVIGPTGDLNHQPLLTVERLQASWGVRNLVGAMYLQFFWLVTSAGELARCKYCGRIISYAPPVRVGEVHYARKPRKDKEFCDSRCRQNYHYHNRIKPNRDSE
jgi:hypothetical protein